MNINKGIRSKRILVLGSIPPPYHGSNVMCSHTLKVLKEIDHDVVLVDKDFSRSIDEIGKFSLRKLISFFQVSKKLVRTIRNNGADICLFFIASGGWALVADLILAKVLYDHKIKYILRFGGRGYSSLRNRIFTSFIRRAFSRAEAGIIMGERLKKDVAGLIDPRKLVRIPNCIEGNPKYEKRKNSKNRELTILFLSNLKPTKGIKEVILALNELVQQQLDKNVRLLIAGAVTDKRSNFLNQLKELIRSKGLEERVEFLGVVAEGKKWEVYNKADIFIFPTYYEKETFGIVNLEAMSSGLPVISTDFVAIPEVIIDGLNGYTVPVKSVGPIVEKLRLLIMNDELRLKMGATGREIFLKQFTFETYKKNLNNLLNDN